MTSAPYSASRQLLARLAGLTALAVAVRWAIGVCELDWQTISRGSTQTAKFLTDFFPPQWPAWREILPAAGTTVVLALAATLIGAIAAIPVAILAARPLTPDWLRMTIRVALGVERALPEILTLLFFVVAFGLGPFAGLMALALGSMGMLAKLLADAIEGVDWRVTESVGATGASYWQRIRYGVLPQVWPALIGTALFRFDVNVRSSVILGAVGAGGIGAEIYRSMGMLQYDRATLAVLASLVVIFTCERGSEWLRAQWLGSGR